MKDNLDGVIIWKNRPSEMRISF